MVSLERSIARLALLAALATALFAVTLDGSTAATKKPNIGCGTAKALRKVPAKPIWFSIKPPESGGGFSADVHALPTFVNGLKWSYPDDRYFWLARLPRGGAAANQKGSITAELEFTNLDQVVKIVRLRDGRLFARWPSSGSGRDVTVVVAKNHSTTEMGWFISSLRKVTWPTNCSGVA
jgi:hypothetical protein